MKLIKNIFGTSILCVLIAGLVSVAAGQIRTVEKSEYDKVDEISAASRKLIRNETSEYRRYKNRKVESETRTERNTESLERASFVRLEIRDGKTTRAFESIRYDGRLFERANEGRWREIIKKGTTNGGSGFSVGGPLEELVQYAIGSTTLDGRKVTVYSRYSVTDIGKSLSFGDFRKYVDESGRVFREHSVFSLIFPANVTTTTLTTYDYDTANVKIEIPRSFDIEER